MPHPPIDQQITFLYTRDLAASAHFYENVLGLKLALDQGSCRIYRVTDSAYVGLCQRDDAPDSTHNRRIRSVILTIVTEEVDAWHDYLRAQGVEFETPPTTSLQYKIYHAFLRDPNGYLIEIQRFADPNWKGA